MSKSRLPLILGGSAVAGIGYYLFSAGGDPKVAENKFEADAHKVSADIKRHLPGRDIEAEKGIGNAGARVGAKFDSAAAEADKQLSAAKSNVEAYAKDAKANTLKAVNDVDRKVENEAAKAKGWFGGSK